MPNRPGGRCVKPMTLWPHTMTSHDRRSLSTVFLMLTIGSLTILIGIVWQIRVRWIVLGFCVVACGVIHRRLEQPFRRRPVRSVALVCCLTGTIGTMTLWGQSLWEGIYGGCVLEERAISFQVAPSFVYLSYSYPVQAARNGWSSFRADRRMYVSSHDAIGWDGAVRRVDAVVFPPYVLVGFLLAYPSCVACRWLSAAYRRCYRRKHGLCIGCGYDLTGAASQVCSECGCSLDETLVTRDSA